MTGRFAPSPTGDLHVGNLRTAFLAWLVARAAGESFVVRVEDLDRANSSAEHEASQLADLAAIGIDWDGPVLRQSERFARYDEQLARLTAAGRTYECYCTRREIREAASAPHGAGPAYPGTCRDLSDAERRRRRRDRPPAIRLRADLRKSITIDDLLAGPVTGHPDDVVLRRNDGVPAYQLAVVDDDADQGVTTVVRGDDLVDSAISQRHLQHLLGRPEVTYAHVPLVVGPTGERLSKRDGAVTLADLAAAGIDTARVQTGLARSLGLLGPDETATPAELVTRFDLARVRALGRFPVAWDDLQHSWS